MDIQDAINILNDIDSSLDTNNWQINTLKTISIYKKNLKVSVNKKIERLIGKQTKYIKKYGEDNILTIKIRKQIIDEINKNFCE